MKIVKRENIFKGHYRLDKVTLKKADEDKTFEREQFIAPDSVGILVHHTKNNSIILVKQYRLGPEMELEEIVAGKLEGKDSKQEDAAEREVMEETGFRIEKIKLIHEFYTSPAPLTEKMYLFYAQVSQKVEEGGGLEEENEAITVIERSVDEFLAHKYQDAKTIIAQQWLKLNQN